MTWVARRDPAELALGVPLALGLVYLVRLAATFQDRLTVVGGDTDAISPLVIAATIDEVPDADVHMAGFGHYLTLAYTRATEWLPFYREVWEVIPPALWIASLAIVVWAAWRTVGRQAAILTGTLGLCVSPPILYILFTSSYHQWTLYSSAIALGLVVFLTTRSGMSVRAWIVVVAGALLLGGALASDRLALVGSIVPLLLAGVGVAIRHPTRDGRRVALLVGAIVAVAIAIAIAVTQIMEAAGYVTTARTERWNDAGLFVDNVTALLEETLWMMNGHFFGRPLSTESALAFVVALGIVPVLTAPFIALRRRTRDPRPDNTPAGLGQSAYIFFCAATMALVPLAIVAGSQGGEVRTRYLLPMLFAAAATVPLLARSVTARYLLVAGVSIYALVGVLNIDVRGPTTVPYDDDVNDDVRTSAGQVAIQANELISVAENEDAHVGYAGYWEAASSSWSTKMRVKVFPIDHVCDAADGVPCPKGGPFVHGGWYEPRADTRTFLIGPRPEDDDSYEPPPGLGRPLSVHRLLNGANLYVYPYDIASRFPPFRVDRSDPNAAIGDPCC